MVLRLGDIAPDFTAETTEGILHFHEWLGDNWGILFSHLPTSLLFAQPNWDI